MSSDELSNRELNLALNVVEREEAMLLSWGVADGMLSFEELRQLLEGSVGDPERVDRILEELHRRAMILRFDHQGRELWRSRMSEAVRLASLQRQLFPGKVGGVGWWRLCSELVADFRFTLRPRTFPVRQFSVDEVGTALREVRPLSQAQQKALAAILRDRKLSDFQLASARRILSDVKRGRSRGLIVGAGTGTGKTLAYYLPALLQIVSSIEADSSHRVRSLSLYPRKELLKDQFTASLGMIQAVNSALGGWRPGRCLTIGALYSDTPFSCSGGKLNQSGRWPAVAEGLVCPYLSDPVTGQRLVWRKADIAAGRERLYVEGGGELVADENVVRLTRSSLSNSPPDLLFSTTEMLQRALCSATSAQLFGVRTTRPPEQVLLDEAHTYGGVSGAQVAYLLRRYRHATGRTDAMHFTGLSATLANAVPFFAELIGLPEHRVASIRADDPNFPQEQAGNEYVLALRGHPYSGAGLLSTTIQTAGLLRRVLDPRSGELGVSTSGGLVGQSVFVFTDDLDVTNRLYDDIADAEGLLQRRGRYGPDPKRDPLAALRSAEGDQEEERFAEGQSWRIAEMVGHPRNLKERLRVDRVSSQDSGVNQQADIVVATAALEVGFDDDHVGAVLQHKAPRSVAQFIQRKGRAGRPQEMRPWTVVTLSDFGRDRQAYQDYHSLFDPEVQPQELPLGNRYILKMQAAAAFVDWATSEVLRRDEANRHRFLDAYQTLNRGPRNNYNRADQTSYASLVAELLEEPEGRVGHALMLHVSSALAIDPEEATALLWEPPRAIMTGVAPTLLRRLERSFETEDGVGEPSSRQPLPEYIPPALFEDLNLPEVVLHPPPLIRGETEISVDQVSMGIASVLRSYAPGKVNRRLGHMASDARHWLPLGVESDGESVLHLDEIVRDRQRVLGDPIGLFSLPDTGEGEQVVQVLRPHEIALEQVPFNVKTMSNAFPVWHTEVLPPSIQGLPESNVSRTSEITELSSLVPEVRFYTHLARCPVEVRRFTTGTRAETWTGSGSNGTSLSKTIVNYKWRGAPAALGFAQEVDAVEFKVRIENEEALCSLVPAECQRSLRSGYLSERIARMRALENASSFDAEAVSSLVIGVLATLPSPQLPARDQLRQHLIAFLDRLAPSSGDAGRGRRGDSVVELLDDDGLLDELVDVVRSATSDSADYREWLRHRARATIGAALLAACGDCVPGRSEDGLLLDVGEAGADTADGVFSIWISEETLGGNGLVERVQQQLTRDERGFFAGFQRALLPSDLEIVAEEVPRVALMLSEDSDLADAADEVRRSSGMAEGREAHLRLRRLLGARGVLCTHSVYSAICHRLVHRGARPGTERILLELATAWSEVEDRIGLEVDARIFSLLTSRNERITELIDELVPGGGRDEEWRTGMIYGLLWPRGAAVRATALASYNPYAEPRQADRLLIVPLLPDATSEVSLADPEWREQVQIALSDTGCVWLTGPSSDLSRALLEVAEVPVEVGYMHVHPLVVDMRRSEDRFKARLEISEAVL